MQGFRSLLFSALLLVSALALACGGDDGNPNGGGGGNAGVDGREDRPRIDEIVPDRGPPGTDVKIHGANFSPQLAKNRVRFNGVTSTIFEVGPDQEWVRTRVPDGATSGKVTVEVDQGEGFLTVEGPVFTVTDDRPVPMLSSVHPKLVTLGEGNVEVTLGGGGFHASSRVLFNGQEVAARRAASTSLELTLTPELVPTLGHYELQVINDPPGGGSSDKLTIEVVAPLGLVRVLPLRAKDLLMTFDKPVNLSTVSRRNVFQIEPQLTIAKIGLDEDDPNSIILIFEEEQVGGTEYTITIVGKSAASTEGGKLLGPNSKTWRGFNGPLVPIDSFGVPGCGADGFASPVGLTFAGDRLYVTEENGNQIQLVSLGETPSLQGFLGNAGGEAGFHESGEASGCGGDEPVEADALFLPRGTIALDGTTVFVGDTGRDRVVALGPEGFEIVAASEEWGSPVVLGSFGGELFFAASDDKIHRIKAGNDRPYPQTGVGRFSFDMEGGGTPALAVDPFSDYVYVTEPGNHRVQRLKGLTTGEGTTTWGVIGKGSPVFDRDDVPTPAAGEGAGDFTRPSGIAIDSLGILYVADEARGGRIQRFNEDGSLLREFLLDFIPAGIAIDGDDVLWVTDPANDLVHRFKL